MPSNGQVTFWTSPTTQDGNDNLFWYNTSGAERLRISKFLANGGTNESYVQEVNGDLWITANAYFDGTNWQRVDTTKYSFAINLRVTNNTPNETKKGTVLWLAKPGANPIGAFGVYGGWQLGWELTEQLSLKIGTRSYIAELPFIIAL